MPFPQIVVPDADDATKVEAAVDVEIAEFDKYFQEELSLAPLGRFEKACLKTYLQWKTRKDSDAQ